MGESLGRSKILLGKMQTEQEHPLILTLRLDTESQAFFDQERERYFPQERNYLKAHLTLFHQLPNDLQTFELLTSIPHKFFEIKVIGLMNLGGGVAYRLESTVLMGLHKKLSSAFADALIPQDRQSYRPHITIQNKVTPQQAKTLLAKKITEFQPFNIAAIGLDVWTYLGGPWKHETFYPFRDL